MPVPSIFCPPPFTSLPTATISPLRTCTEPPGISPSAPSIVITWALAMVNSPRAGSLGEAASTEALVFHVAAVCLRIELTVRLERPGDQQLPVVAVGQQISSLFVSGSSAPSGLMQDRKSFTIGLARRSWDTRSPLSRGSAVVLAGQRPRARDAEARRASDFRNQPTTSA